MIDGLVVVDKPAGWTSHDVVARCRRIFGQKRVGHAGTLDPGATGVLLLGLGRVTRLLRLLRGHGLLDKIPASHRYQVGAEARTRIQALLACRNANPDQLVANAA